MSVDPAYAGMILITPKSVVTDECGPRVCGDDPRIILLGRLVKEWTPRMRG